MKDYINSKEVEMTVENLSDDAKLKTIHGVLLFMCGEVVPTPEPLQSTKRVDPTYEQEAPPRVDTKQLTTAYTPPVPAPTLQQAGRPRTLQAVNGERSLTSSLGDNNALQRLAENMRQEADSKPYKNTFMEQPDGNDPLETGIQFKMLNGQETKCYRVAYKCLCGATGRRYMTGESKYAKCHQCATPLEMRLAVSGKPFEQDADGNFFIADREYVFPKIPPR